MRLPLRTGLPVVAGLIAWGLAVGAAPAGPAVPSGQVCEGVVVDEGTGVAPAPQTADVAPGASDLDALDAAGDTATQNSSGLVCGIDAYPANALQACLGSANGLYYYWSYWEGNPATDTWTYAQVGPAEHTVSAAQTYVEGWRYQDPGPDGPSATKPSVSPAAAFAQACPGVTPVATSGGGGSGGGGGSSGGGGGSTQGGAATATPPVTTPTASPGPAPGAAAQVPASASAPPRPAPAAPSRSGGGSGAAAPTTVGNGATSTTTTASGSQASATRRTTTAKLALTGAAAQRGAGGDPALPVIVVAVLIGLIGVAAWYRWRRRPVQE